MPIVNRYYIRYAVPNTSVLNNFLNNDIDTDINNVAVLDKGELNKCKMKQNNETSNQDPNSNLPQ